MPMMATRSLMPLLAMPSPRFRCGCASAHPRVAPVRAAPAAPSSDGRRPCCAWPPSSAGARFPEVVHDAVGGEHAAERHLDLVADRDRFGLAVGHLAEEATAAVEVEHDA